MSNTELSIRLKPHGVVKPIVTYGLDSEVNTITLEESCTLSFSVDLTQGNHVFYLEYSNKTNDTADMAVEIEWVEFEGMQLDRFKWAGKYYPNYPEPWASEQTEVLPAVRDYATFLGWNGRWELTFSVPIFVWIHQIENLGWIYG